LAAAQLPDMRLEKRLQYLVEQMAAGLGRSIPLACQDWSATKAAYRFFSNERICEEQILAGHFEATRDSVPRTESILLTVFQGEAFQACTLGSFKEQVHIDVGPALGNC